jgi:hypothetical protein
MNDIARCVRCCTPACFLSLFRLIPSFFPGPGFLGTEMVPVRFHAFRADFNLLLPVKFAAWACLVLQFLSLTFLRNQMPISIVYFVSNLLMMP